MRSCRENREKLRAEVVPATAQVKRGYGKGLLLRPFQLNRKIRLTLGGYKTSEQFEKKGRRGKGLAHETNLFLTLQTGYGRERERDPGGRELHQRVKEKGRRS